MTLVATSLGRRICADLLDREPKDVARKRGRSRWSVYKHRRRFELRNGVQLPRLHRIGRPANPVPVDTGRLMSSITN